MAGSNAAQRARQAANSAVLKAMERFMPHPHCCAKAISNGTLNSGASALTLSPSTYN
jgi:hypothetical protein